MGIMGNAGVKILLFTFQENTVGFCKCGRMQGKILEVWSDIYREIYFKCGVWTFEEKYIGVQSMDIYREIYTECFQPNFG